METSIFLAQVIGIFSATFALALIFNSRYISKTFEELIDQKGVIFLIGMIALAIGIFWINSHNIWNASWWIIIISIIGWLSFIKGIILMVYPQ
ncbi:hypothetical protein GF376_03700, partial [Candidatus Peregrinibacteria bacterium]|nr:hypothetical protein [Candidatus Peregrinibacteria bacterium]